MRSRLLVWVMPLALLGLPACSHAAAALAPTSSAPVSGTGHARATAMHRPKVLVSPASGTPSTHFTVSFRAVALPSTRSGLLRRYWISAEGPAHAGCTSTAASGLAPGRAGVLERARLAPGTGGWCRGTYRGRVVLVESPQCSRGMLCPMFVAIASTVGRFSFRVR